MEWHVVCEPISRNHEREAPESEWKKEETSELRNDGGLAIILTDGIRRHETTRVAFVRRRSANKKKTFKQQLREEIANAEAAAKAMNDKVRRAKELEQQARVEADQAQRRSEETREAARRAEQDAIREVESMPEAASLS